MRNLHQIILQEYGIEVWHLFRNWERLQLREIDYKNHRIFTLRCLHRELVPVSLKLKSTLNTTRAKKIIRKAEKELIQATIKSINNILTNVAIQLEQCRSQLASIISTERLRECQGFVDKVGETRFNKVKNRQIKKFQNVVNKKEGNITWSSNNNNNLPQAINNPNRQAGAPLPPREGTNTPQLDLSLLLRKEKVLISLKHLPSSQAIAPFFPGREQFPGNCTPSLPGRKQFTLSKWPPRQFCLGKAAIPLQVSLLLGKEAILPPKQVNLIIKIGPSGKALGTLIGTGLPKLPRRTTLSPRKITPLIPPIGPPRIFQ